MSAPRSTYRLQIRPGLTLADAADLTGYLVELGVDAVYLSPVLTATSSSDHGYDTVDPTTIDPARGGEHGWRRLVEACRAAGLKIVLDIVPNHLGISAPHENPAWWSVLAEGRDSAYASWFDIDWDRAPILVPILGDDGLAAVTIEATDQGHELCYHEHRFPVAAGTYAEGDTVAQLHARQHYRLAHWEAGDADVNYRRFFAISTLAGVRQEDPAVFEATHARVLRMVADGEVDGLRIDHPDGLTDPQEYLVRLTDRAPGQWIVAEKILEPDEELPAAWPIAGTTGYDAMTEVCHAFIDPAAEKTFTALQREVVGDEHDLEDHVLAGKTRAATTLLAAERDRLARLAPDTEPEQVQQSVVALAAHLAVYRSYPKSGHTHLLSAFVDACETHPDLEETLIELLPRLSRSGAEIARRFQQYSSAVMAKGVEDTAYYRANRFVALNEVGGNPARFGLEPEDFHAALAWRQERWPLGMTALSTHDTKRSEDVRARLAVLSELPELATAWIETYIENSGIPDRSLANLLGQTFLGAGLIERARMHAYAEKAMREAAVGTSWTHPDEGFEAAVHGGVDVAYDDIDINDGLQRLLTQIEQPGWSNALGQKLVQLTAPGVPDVYQGTELWDDSLVDPDNRRPVDFGVRRELLGLAEAPRVDASGAAKLWVVRHALRLRRERPELFTGYLPRYATGPAAHHLLAFDRGGAITLVTRLPYTLSTGHDGWGDTAIDLDGAWRDELTGSLHQGPARLGTVFEQLPVALLVRCPE